MKLLLDTHCWLWWLAEPERLNEEALGAITDQKNELYFSAASAWELAIKVGLGKLELPERLATYVPAKLTEDGIAPLAVEHTHALQVAELPPLHRDPFDRLLVAQAQLEGLTLLTADRDVMRYGVALLWGGTGREP